MKTMPKPYDFDHFGLGRVGEYFSNFSNQNVWGKCGKSKNALDFFDFKSKPMGRLTWECGVWKVRKQSAWATRNSKQNALGLLHLDCHGLPEQRFLKKIGVQNLLKNNA